MKNPIKKLQQNKVKLDKLKNKIDKFKEKQAHFRELFESDGVVTEKERGCLERLSQKIAAAETAIEERGTEIELKLAQVNKFRGNTTRVKGCGNKSKFAIKDEKGAIKQFPGKGKISITENMEVVVLTKEVIINDKKHLTLKEIIFWEEEEYYRGYLELAALTEINEDDEVSDKNLLKAFLNDVEHALFRVENRICEHEKVYKYFTEEQVVGFKEKSAGFVKLKKDIEYDIALVANKKIKLNGRILDEIQRVQTNLLKSQSSDIGNVILKLEKNITNSYNPKEGKGKTLKDVVNVIPFTEQWFLSDPFLEEIYYSRKLDSLISWKGNSGEILTEGYDGFEPLIEAIHFMKKNLDRVPNGSEKKWIESISISKLKKSKGLIIIHSESIKKNLKDLFASNISTLQQFATLKIIPIQTILIHEMNMSEATVTIGKDADTHIEPENVEYAHNKVSSNESEDLSKLQRENPEMIDELYQSDSYLELVNIKYVLDKIKELQ